MYVEDNYASGRRYESAVFRDDAEASELAAWKSSNKLLPLSI